MTKKCDMELCYSRPTIAVKSISPNGDSDMTINFFICSKHYEMINPEHKRILIISDSEFDEKTGCGGTYMKETRSFENPEKLFDDEEYHKEFKDEFKLTVYKFKRIVK